MKVIYILSGTKLQDGSTKSFLHLIGILKKRGFEILVICPDKKGVFQYLQNLGIACISIQYIPNWLPVCKSNSDYFLNGLRLIKRFAINSWVTLRLCFICKQFQPDIIHTNTSVNDIGYLAGKICRLPHVWHIREYGDLDFGNTIPFLESRLCASNNYSIAITKDIACHRKVLNQSNNRVIYNGIINSATVPDINLNKEPFFLFAGRCTKGKGFNDLINAYIKYCREVKDPLILKVTGNKEDSHNTIEQWELLKASHLEGKVEWIGMRKDIEVFMSKAMAVIIPSKCEGFGRVMAESMYNGCLAIGRNTGGTKEQLDNGCEIAGEEIGLRYNTEEELVKHLKDITEYGIFPYRSMMNCAQQVVLRLYTSEVYADNVISFYEKILNN